MASSLTRGSSPLGLTRHDACQKFGQTSQSLHQKVPRVKHRKRGERKETNAFYKMTRGSDCARIYFCETMAERAPGMVIIIVVSL